MNTDKNSSRRQFLLNSGKLGLLATLSIPTLSSFANEKTAKPLVLSADGTIDWTQQALGYAYTALEPSIDAMTMEIHYTKHAATYTKNLADATKAEGVDTSATTIEQLLGNISKYSPKMRNNAGGHYNHELFWRSMKAPSADNAPSGKLLEMIKRDFNSLEAFKTQFSDAGKNRFGSGWAWLVLTGDKKLIIGSTPNQDNPLMNVSDLKGFPVLGLDVWEHAYYLKYQNRRPDYINAWWNTVDWNFVEKRLHSVK